MMDPAIATAFDATWPAQSLDRIGGFRVSHAPGGGGRLNAARALGPWTEDDIDAVIRLQSDRGTEPLFLVPDDEHTLARSLAARGLAETSPTAVLQAPVAALTDRTIPPVTAMAIWPPLAVQRALWAENGIGPGRQAAMDRVEGPKTALLGRVKDRAAGVGFVAVAQSVAMVHALAVPDEFRRLGVAAWMMRAAAFFSADHGATRIALAAARANHAAVALYDNLGFVEVAGYRYFERAQG